MADRIKRKARNIGNSSIFNPFCRLRQHYRLKMLANTKPSDSTDAILDPPDFEMAALEDGVNSRRVSNGQPRSPPTHEESSVSSMAGPTRTNTIRLEEGRPQNIQEQSYYSDKEQKAHKGIFGQLKAAVFNSWINVLLVFVPVGIATHYAGVDPTIVFILNFIAIIPLAALLSYGTEEIALYCGEVLGGLLNASFGNAVELIVSILALRKREIIIVQTSLIGSILSNLLLVLGMAFIAGGFNRIEQNFNTTVAQTASSLLALAVGSLIVPTAFHLASTAGDVGITELSRGTSIILLLVYASYLGFQLKTHSALYNAPSEKTPVRNPHKQPAQALVSSSATVGQAAVTGAGVPAAPQEEDEEEPELTLWAALTLLAASTILVALCAECLVSSINHLVTTTHISRAFVGLVLLPIVGNAAEHATAVTVAVKDKMDLSISVAVGSSMQIALLVIPFIVVLGWCMGISEMTLYFDGFQVMILFVTVLLVNYLIQDGKSNYLEGNLLVALYLIIALAAWFYPEDGALASEKR